MREIVSYVRISLISQHAQRYLIVVDLILHNPSAQVLETLLAEALLRIQHDFKAVSFVLDRVFGDEFWPQRDLMTKISWILAGSHLLRQSRLINFGVFDHHVLVC